MPVQYWNLDSLKTGCETFTRSCAALPTNLALLRRMTVVYGSGTLMHRCYLSLVNRMVTAVK